MKKEKQLAREIRFLGQTQKEFAEKLGVHENTVSNWVIGSATISPVFFRKMMEMGIPVKALKDPIKEI